MPARNAFLSRTLGLLAAGLALAHAGCLPKSISSWLHKEKPNYHANTMPDQDTSPSKMNGEMTRAHDLFNSKDYSSAARLFARIADNTENSAAVAEEALFYQAECERLRDKLPTAESTYKKVLHDFPSGAFKQQACQRLYEIAVLWLKDTDIELGQYAEKMEGKRTFVMPASLRINIDKTKPTFDAEGRAIQALEVVHYSDMTGPLADKALFLAGYVKYYREDYAEADHYFTALLQYNKDSPLAPRACEMAIRSKVLAAGGADYDGRRVAEARQLIDTALRAYPELTKDEEAKQKMTEHLYEVTAAQAEKDLKRAEFYERTHHFGSAYFVYERIVQRFPQTKFEAIAQARMAKLKPLMEKAEAGIDIDEGPFDRIQKRWLRLIGDDPENSKNGSRETSPNALPAGMGPGR
jgi:outer membrane protein assembly factor BamD (BamD/ComL family)